MKEYRCNECFRYRPCVLTLEDIGDVPPTLCPFDTPKKAIAEWRITKHQNKTLDK